MRWLVFYCALVLFSQTVSAEWQKILSDQYIDYSRTTRMSKDIVRTWIMVDDRGSESRMNFLSHISYEEFDCLQRSYKTLGTVFYSGALATGKIVATRDGDGKTRFLIPNTKYEAMMHFACIEDLARACHEVCE